MLLIKNGTVKTMEGPDILGGEVLIDGGKIAAVGKNLAVPEGTEIFDAAGCLVAPGLIDGHCHIGLHEEIIGAVGLDINETTSPTTPQLRAIDAINPMDEGLSEALKAGVTCAVTGPGSANVVGGTFCAIKLFGKRVDKMIVKDAVAMKCAFGENPKRCYKDKNNYSRMSTASKLREMLMKAQEYDRKITAAGDDESKRPPLDVKLEALRPVIRKEMPLKAHAHQANDIFTAIRIAREFQVGLTLEHVTEGHLIVEELKEEPYPMAVGPSLTHASKFELRNKTFETPGILASAGCQVSIITDSPVIPQQYLPLCAGLAVKSGMKENDALKAITINPARHIGIEDRVGSLEIGKDADIVVMEGSCFEVSARMCTVIVNGKVEVA